MKAILIVALAVVAVHGKAVQYGFPSFQYSSITGRIVGGTEATPHIAPYIVSLQANGEHFCAGTIIAEKIILTAAHCMFYGVSPTVVGGLHNLDNTNGTQSRTIFMGIRHESYPGGVGPYDIGLYILDDAFDFNDIVQPIGLPNDGEISSGNATLYGWGVTSYGITPNYPKDLMTATQPIIYYNDCEASLGGPGGSPLDPKNICTGSSTGSVSACNGDSGGPLVQGNKTIGIVSWGFVPCGTYGYPSIYTRVSAYIDWIANNTSV